MAMIGEKREQGLLASTEKFQFSIFAHSGPISACCPSGDTQLTAHHGYEAL